MVAAVTAARPAKSSAARPSRVTGPGQGGLRAVCAAPPGPASRRRRRRAGRGADGASRRCIVGDDAPAGGTGGRRPSTEASSARQHRARAALPTPVRRRLEGVGALLELRAEQQVGLAVVRRTVAAPPPPPRRRRCWRSASRPADASRHRRASLRSGRPRRDPSRRQPRSGSSSGLCENGGSNAPRDGSLALTVTLRQVGIPKPFTWGDPLPDPFTEIGGASWAALPLDTRGLASRNFPVGPV